MGIDLLENIQVIDIRIQFLFRTLDGFLPTTLTKTIRKDWTTCKGDTSVSMADLSKVFAIYGNYQYTAFSYNRVLVLTGVLILQ